MTGSAFERMHALARRGYFPLLGDRNEEGVEDVVCMIHPRQHAKKRSAHPVEVYDDGRIVVVHGNGERHRIEPEDQKTFESYLQSVKKPTFYDLHIGPFLYKIFLIFVLFMFFSLTALPIHFIFEALGYSSDDNPLFLPLMFTAIVALAIFLRTPKFTRYP